jgi:hypothetical protein
MDRIEHTVQHGQFRIIATSAKVLAHSLKPERWDALVSVWRLRDDARAEEPVMIDFRDRKWPNAEQAISEAIAVAKQRIDTADPSLRENSRNA